MLAPEDGSEELHGGTELVALFHSVGLYVLQEPEAQEHKHKHKRLRSKRLCVNEASN